MRNSVCTQGEVTKRISTMLELNAKFNYNSCNDSPLCIEDTSKVHSLKNLKEIKPTKICREPISLSLNLNSQVISSSCNHECVQAHETLSECGSTCGSIGENDSMRLWKQMKQNGFLSSFNGNVIFPSLPKPCGKKRGNESVVKKRIEMAKREQVDRFAKVAAPCGLLNGLNPGIINQVRNRKQVHSIIEALVRSARIKSKSSEHKQDDGTLNHLYPSRKCDDDVLKLKLSSASTVTFEDMSSLPNYKSANISTVDSLSVKGASVASQWLELLYQDIKGRLAALRHSKKRVQSVTQTELPHLIASHLSSKQENDSSAAHLANKAQNNMHKIRWTALFDQMHKSLSVEEKNLENTLNQVREMLLHCEHGLLEFPPANGFQQQATLQTNYMYLKAQPALDKDLAVRAAAAAIFSTSNLLQTPDNLPCF
uniref:uncharacterized protein LOC122588985 n=1 Tax=Erigeron canadensis TaxID=72917 RepID=UPI001CB8C6E8|nr:uncharacterized protein LOC122588985 [Erigeron canadensis]